jgi:D-alanine-D-alanine ligase
MDVPHKRLKVAVVMGGFSEEREISLLSGANVCEHLNPEIFEVFPIDIAETSWECIIEKKRYPIDKRDFSLPLNETVIHFDVVFNAIHGSPGEDGLFAAYLQLLGIKQTASDHYSSALSFNKHDLLCIARELGIPTAKSQAIHFNNLEDYSEVLEHLKLPVFVKANRSGSSFGIEKIDAAEALPEALKRVAEVDKDVLIEEALVGPEITIGVVRLDDKLEALPATLIETDNVFFDYEAKYQGASREITPAPLPKAMIDSANEMAIKLHDHLGLQGVSRSEFILVDGVPHLLEINTTPGLTKKSLIPQQIAAHGSTLSALFEAMIHEALRH